MDQDFESTADDWTICPLCQNALHFEYEIDYVLLKVEERSYCLSCGFMKKPTEGTIQ